MEYIFLFTLTLFLSFFADIGRKNYWFKKNNFSYSEINYEKNMYILIYIIMFMILFIFASIRYNVGTDYILYSNYQIPQVLNGNVESVELFYRAVIKSGNFLGDYQWIFIITHLLILLPLMSSFARDSQNLFITFYVFLVGGFFNHSLNIMRQTIAIVIFFYALKYIYERKFPQYLIAISIAFFFHKTAILYIIIYFMYNMKFTKKRTLLIILVSFISVPVVKFALEFISGKFGIYENYINKWFAPQPLSGSYILINGMILLIVFLVSFLNDNKFDEKTNFYINIQVITVMILFFHSVLPNYDRVMFMFYPVQALLIPKLANGIKNRILRYSILIILFLLYAYVFVRIYLIQNIGGTFPYQTIFSK